MTIDPARRPGVSIILPTYNRAAFLAQAFEAIRNQDYSDWELIVVDDGSTDTTEEVVGRLADSLPRACRYIRQLNSGPSGARNTGLDHAMGRAVAFYDSDDTWLPHHLSHCLEALDAHPELDWVYAACRIVELPSLRELAPSTFFEDGKRRPFLDLNHRVDGNLHLIQDGGAIRCALLHGLFCGLQGSVLRREVFTDYRLPMCRIGEDQIMAIELLARGHQIGYFDDVHVVYHVHEENTSASASGMDLAKRISIYKSLLQGLHQLLDSGILLRRDKKALEMRIAKGYFWELGYALYWQHGYRAEALASFRRGLSFTPWDVGMWKTLLLATLRGSWFRSPEPLPRRETRNAP